MTAVKERLTRSRRAEQGLTLLEVLIAFVLLSLVALLAADGLSFGARAWETAREKGGTGQDVQIIQSQLQTHVASAVARLPLALKAEGTPAFAGGGERLVFTSPAPAALAMGGLARFTLATEPMAQGGKRLVLVLTPEATGFAAPPKDPATWRSILLEEVESVAFAYFGRAEGQSEPRWYDRWENDQRLPQLVRMTVEFPARDGRVWPDLLLKPREGVLYGPA